MVVSILRIFCINDNTFEKDQGMVNKAKTIYSKCSLCLKRLFFKLLSIYTFLESYL